jgi:hypothetical protein
MPFHQLVCVVPARSDRLGLRYSHRRRIERDDAMCLERVCGVCESDVGFGEIDTRDSNSEVGKLSEDERDGSMIGQPPSSPRSDNSIFMYLYIGI